MRSHCEICKNYRKCGYDVEEREKMKSPCYAYEKDGKEIKNESTTIKQP